MECPSNQLVVGRHQIYFGLSQRIPVLPVPTMAKISVQDFRRSESVLPSTLEAAMSWCPSSIRPRELLSEPDDKLRQEAVQAQRIVASLQIYQVLTCCHVASRLIQISCHVLLSRTKVSHVVS